MIPIEKGEIGNFVRVLLRLLRSKEMFLLQYWLYQGILQTYLQWSNTIDETHNLNILNLWLYITLS